MTGPVVADQDGFTVDEIGGVEIAAAVAECADLGRVEAADAAVGPIEAPLPRRRIVQPQRESFDVAAASIEFERVELGAAVPDLVAGEGPTHVSFQVG